MGLIDTKWDLEKCDSVTASSFCRRRLPVVMVHQRMAQTVRMATQLIQQGHVRVGTELIKDPAFVVTRYMTMTTAMSYYITCSLMYAMYSINTIIVFVAVLGHTYILVYKNASLPITISFNFTLAYCTINYKARPSI